MVPSIDGPPLLRGVSLLSGPVSDAYKNTSCKRVTPKRTEVKEFLECFCRNGLGPGLAAIFSVAGRYD
jgi:hypothetical protein